jgi:hypothetical protein
VIVKEVRPIDLNEIFLADSTTRSEGLHLSTITKDMLMRLNSKRFGGEVTNDVKALWELGFLFEILAGRAMSLRYKQTYPSPYLIPQLELESDGVLMTLDLFNALRDKVHEFKATKISMRNPITDNRFHHWFWQNKSYCRAARTRKARFDVMFINGAYDLGQLGPVRFKAWEVEYTKQELQSNWRMVLNHKRYMESEGLI